MKHLRKCILLTIAAVLTLPMFFSQGVFANSSINVLLADRNLSVDQPPVIENGRVLVPMRVIFEELGATVQWNSTTKTVTATKENIAVRLTINNPNASINGKINRLDVPATIKNGRTLVPLRFVSEALGATVQWNNQTKTVLINSNASAEGNATHQQFFTLLNEERKKHGVAPLQLDQDVSQVANVKAKDMRDHQYFAHTSPTYGNPSQLLQHFGITPRRVGENLAMGQTTPQAAIGALMNSPGHRANILSSQYTHVGVGHAQGNTGPYWVQIFVTH